MTTRLAFATDDGETIHAHFGQAQYYEIVEVVDGEMKSRNRVPKYSPHHQHGGAHHGGGHGHAAMFETIADCDYLVGRGMGEGAIQGAQTVGVEVILCDEHTIEEALESFKTGALKHNPKRVHQHHGMHH